MIYAEQQHPTAVVDPVYQYQQQQQQPIYAPVPADPNIPPPPPLPIGWLAHWDRGQQKYYYHNLASGAVTWEPPQPTPISTPPVNPNEAYPVQQLQYSQTANQGQHQYQQQQAVSPQSPQSPIQQIQNQHQYQPQTQQTQQTQPQPQPQQQQQHQQWQAQQPAPAQAWTNHPPHPQGTYQQPHAPTSPHYVLRKSVSLRSPASTPHPIGYAEVAGSEVPPKAALHSGTPAESGLMLTSECSSEPPPPLPGRETPTSTSAPTTSPPPAVTSHAQEVNMQHPKPQVPPGPMNVPLLNRSLSVSSVDSVPLAPGPIPINPQGPTPVFYTPPNQGQSQDQGPAANPQYQQKMPPIYAKQPSTGFSSILPPHQPLTLQSTINPRKPALIRPMSKKPPSSSLSTGANMAVAGMGTMAKASGLAIKKTFKGSGDFFVPKKVKPVQRQIQQGQGLGVGMQTQMPMRIAQQQMPQQQQHILQHIPQQHIPQHIPQQQVQQQQQQQIPQQQVPQQQILHQGQVQQQQHMQQHIPQQKIQQPQQQNSPQPQQQHIQQQHRQQIPQQTQQQQQQGTRSIIVNGMAPMAPVPSNRGSMATRGGVMANGNSGMALMENSSGMVPMTNSQMVSGTAGMATRTSPMVTGRGGMNTIRNGPTSTRGEPMRGGITPMTTGTIAGPLMTAARGGGYTRGRGGAQMGGGRGMPQTHIQPVMGRTVFQPAFTNQIPPQHMNQHSLMTSPTTIQVGRAPPQGAERRMSTGMGAPVCTAMGMPGVMLSQSAEQQMTAQERIIQQQQQQIEQQNQQIAHQQHIMKQNQLQQRKMGAGGMAVGAVGGMVVAGGIAVGAARLMSSKPPLLQRGLQATTGLQRQQNPGTQQRDQQQGDQATVQGDGTPRMEEDAQGDVSNGGDAEEAYTDEVYVEEDATYTEGYGVSYQEVAYIDTGAGYPAYQDTRANEGSYVGDGYGGEGYTEEDYTGGGEEYGGEEYGGEEGYSAEPDYSTDYGSADIGGGGEELLESPPFDLF